MTSSDPSIADIDRFGFLNASKSGEVTITAESEGLTAVHQLQVKANPVTRIELAASEVDVRTGDVVQFKTKLVGEAGEELKGVPVQYSFVASPDDNLGNGSTGQIEQDGRFVAETPGLYTCLLYTSPSPRDS